MTDAPRRIHTYQNHILDGPRWDRYEPRPTDVVVATPYKTGTTWTLAILRELFALEEDMPPFREMWLDCRFRQTADAFFDELEAQAHRRYIKSHLALDGLPWFPEVKYIVVGRDPRDVFMSWWNHIHAMHEAGSIARINALPDRVGPPLPDPPESVREAWRSWIGRGWFGWEQEGWPFWGTMHHIQSWWQFRHLANILFVHFEDLKRDLDAEVLRIARFVEVDVQASHLPGICAAVSVDAMRDQMASGSEAWANGFFRHRGTSGRWQGVLTAGDLELYERKGAAVLDEACRAWLEGAGGPNAEPSSPRGG